ncbi:MAG: thiol:disulfide interchange protein [marine bacterium B5-7]|nr:MAG: thiol:disulfide interchange protein [marine bacterium B5-7]
MRDVRKIAWLLPLLCFLGLALFLWRGLSLNPRNLPSALQDKPAPSFSLPTMDGKAPLTRHRWYGHVAVLNFWASWCMACHVEHPILIDIARHYHVPLYGIAYKDKRAAVQHWLKTMGDPYQAVGLDKQGRVGLAYGVYGTPETFIIDKKGIIRYRHIGAITHRIWETELWPRIQKLQSASA